MSHLIEMSNITTRANNQFPRPDFHRLDKQPYRLQPSLEGIGYSSPPVLTTASHAACGEKHLIRRTKFSWYLSDLRAIALQSAPGAPLHLLSISSLPVRHYTKVEISLD
jgi:hypothetical protein